MADFLSKWKNGLERTRKVAFGRLATFFGASEISEETWDELESILIQADLGMETTEDIIKVLKKVVAVEGLTRPEELQTALRDEMLNRLEPIPPSDLLEHKPAIVLLVGVNGSGKTTTAAKLGKQFTNRRKTVLLAAADTYRAAAVDQLQVWGDRLNLPVIAGQPNADQSLLTQSRPAFPGKRTWFWLTQPAASTPAST
jgi:fused signal recognition particle receptor